MMFLIVLWIFILVSVVISWMLYTEIFGAGYQPAPDASVKKMIEFAELNKKSVVCDLGCGDGKILINASPCCKKAIGVEIDPIRTTIAKTRTKKFGNIEIKEGNLFNYNLKDVDAVFIFLRQRTNDKLKEKFLKEMKKGSVVISYYWTLDLPTWKKDDKLKVRAYKIN